MRFSNRLSFSHALSHTYQSILAPMKRQLLPYKASSVSHMTVPVSFIQIPSLLSVWKRDYPSSLSNQAMSYVSIFRLPTDVLNQIINGFQHKAQNQVGCNWSEPLYTFTSRNHSFRSSSLDIQFYKRLSRKWKGGTHRRAEVQQENEPQLSGR